MCKSAKRVHVTGGAGSGKTLFAQRLATARSVPHYELDDVLMAAGARAEQIDAAAVSQLAKLPEWVSDGVFFGWALPFLQGAHAIVWLDIPWRVASYRLVTRHLRLEVTRKNPHPGWRHFYKFWRRSAAFYGNSTDGRVDRFGSHYPRHSCDSSSPIRGQGGRVPYGCRGDESAGRAVRRQDDLGPWSSVSAGRQRYGEEFATAINPR